MATAGSPDTPDGSQCPWGSPTCPSKAATLAVLTTSPRWPSVSGLFWLISCALRRITLKVPTRFTCRREKDLGGVLWTPPPAPKHPKNSPHLQPAHPSFTPLTTDTPHPIVQAPPNAPLTLMTLWKSSRS